MVGNFFRRALVAAAVCGAVAAAGTTASAGLLPVNVTVTPEAENFRWTYAIVLPTDMKLQSGNFFTIYDFAGYISGADVVPEGWSVRTDKLGPTPDRLNPADDPNVTNLTYTYTGPTIESGQIGLGNFMAASTFERQADSFLTARTNRSSDGRTDSNITESVVPTGLTDPEPPVDPEPTPTPAPGVPEPTTLALAALGLIPAGLARLARRKKA